jgi:hypothetical protein
MLTINFLATLGVGLPASCHMASRGSFSLDSEYCVDIETIGVATARRRLASVVSYCIGYFGLCWVRLFEVRAG